MSATVTFRAGTASDTGRHRSNNEDRVYADESRGIFLVVDGVGGHAAGEKAAETAIEVIPQQLEALKGGLEDRIRGAITAANNRIFELSQENEDWRGMACVLTLAVLEDDRVTVGHVGDSRLYLVWDGNLKKLTPDHSPVGELEDQGELTEAEAMTHPRRNEVFRDVGLHLHEPTDDHFIEIKSCAFHTEAALLLCSDGLSDVLTSSEIGTIIETFDGDPEHVARQLVEAANQAGGKDNVSVIFVAGPEFVGSASKTMAEARTRHAITRQRGSSRHWKKWLTRATWFIAGIITGIISAMMVLRHV